jgi:hypothetical protein
MAMTNHELATAKSSVWVYFAVFRRYLAQFPSRVVPPAWCPLLNWALPGILYVIIAGNFGRN